jgi:hypothetical protein
VAFDGWASDRFAQPGKKPPARSAGERRIWKLQAQITHEFYAAFERLGADPELLGWKPARTSLNASSRNVVQTHGSRRVLAATP